MAEDIKPKSKVGRPKKDFTIEEIKKLCTLNCTMEEVAAFFGCNKKTIERRMLDDPEISEAIDMGRNMGRLSLRRKQMELVNKGNAAMAIFLGKQILGQRDKNETEISSPDGSLQPTQIVLQGVAAKHESISSDTDT
jgi:hypothetical protein